MKTKKILYLIKETLVVSKCPSCGAVTRRSGTLCEECLEKYTGEKERECVFCKLPAGECVCSTRELYYCKQLGRSMYSPLFYGSGGEVTTAALKSLKYSADRGAEKFFARELSHEIIRLFAGSGEFPEDWCVTYPPRRKRAVREYGFDQAKGLAKRIAKYTGMKFEKPLFRRGGAAQKTLDREGRKENAGRSFGLGERSDVSGRKYVIVDDIITTGSTVKACQTILLGSGAAAAFALSAAKTPMRGEGYDPKLRFRKRRGDVWFREKGKTH